VYYSSLTLFILFLAMLTTFTLTVENPIHGNNTCDTIRYY
jgi:hypothetical protein